MLLIGRAEEPQESVDRREMVVYALQPVVLVVELRQPVSWAVDNSKDLWNGNHEIEKLRNEKQQQSF